MAFDQSGLRWLGISDLIGRRAEGLAEGLLLGDERALTECNADFSV
jgi:hypothetical protein